MVRDSFFLVNFDVISPIALRMAKTLWSFGQLHDRWSSDSFFLVNFDVISPIALRMSKTPQSFGHSECNRVN